MSNPKRQPQDQTGFTPIAGATTGVGPGVGPGVGVGVGVTDFNPQTKLVQGETHSQQTLLASKKNPAQHEVHPFESQVQQFALLKVTHPELYNTYPVQHVVQTFPFGPVHVAQPVQHGQHGLNVYYDAAVAENVVNKTVDYLRQYPLAQVVQVNLESQVVHDGGHPTHKPVTVFLQLPAQHVEHAQVYGKEDPETVHTQHPPGHLSHVFVTVFNTYPIAQAEQIYPELLLLAVQVVQFEIDVLQSAQLVPLAVRLGRQVAQADEDVPQIVEQVGDDQTAQQALLDRQQLSLHQNGITPDQLVFSKAPLHLKNPVPAELHGEQVTQLFVYQTIQYPSQHYEHVVVSLVPDKILHELQQLGQAVQVVPVIIQYGQQVAQVFASAPHVAHGQLHNVQTQLFPDKVYGDAHYVQVPPGHDVHYEIPHGLQSVSGVVAVESQQQAVAQVVQLVPDVHEIQYDGQVKHYPDAPLDQVFELLAINTFYVSGQVQTVVTVDYDQQYPVVHDVQVQADVHTAHPVQHFEQNYAKQLQQLALLAGADFALITFQNEKLQLKQQPAQHSVQLPFVQLIVKHELFKIQILPTKVQPALQAVHANATSAVEQVSVVHPVGSTTHDDVLLQVNQKQPELQMKVQQSVKLLHAVHIPLLIATHGIHVQVFQKYPYLHVGAVNLATPYDQSVKAYLKQFDVVIVVAAVPGTQAYVTQIGLALHTKADSGAIHYKQTQSDIQVVDVYQVNHPDVKQKPYQHIVHPFVQFAYVTVTVLPLFVLLILKQFDYIQAHPPFYKQYPVTQAVHKLPGVQHYAHPIQHDKHLPLETQYPGKHVVHVVASEHTEHVVTVDVDDQVVQAVHAVLVLKQPLIQAQQSPIAGPVHESQFAIHAVHTDQVESKQQ